VDWIAAFRKRAADEGRKAEEAVAKAADARDAASRPSLPLAKYSGRYRDPWSRWRVAFMSDTQPADAYVSFAFQPDASSERMSMTPASPAIDFSFDFQDLLFTPVP
jgi:hypothetical protein